MIDTAQWISSLNIHYTLGVDGISVLFVPLTNLLFIGVVLSSWTHIKKQSNLYYSMLLLLATASIGIFVAIDTVSFFLFWEITLIPIYFCA
jgi:NADH-quinone oxidoreductase subunit M